MKRPSHTKARVMKKPAGEAVPPLSRILCRLLRIRGRTRPQGRSQPWHLGTEANPQHSLCVVDMGKSWQLFPR